MRYVALGLVLSLLSAAALVVLIDRSRGGPPPSAELLQGMERRLAALEQRLAAPARSSNDPRTIAEIATLTEETQSLVLDAERGLRRDLQGIYERLLARLDELSLRNNASAAEADPAARAKVHARLAELGITLRLDAGELELSGAFSETDRPLEFLAVAPGGRAYEALFLVDVAPAALKVAIEELGFTETDPDPETFRWAADTRGVFVYAHWEGEAHPCRVESLVWNRETDAPMQSTPWMFTASRFFTDNRTWERYFAADLYKNLIALSLTYAAEALLANPLDCASNENIFYPNKDRCPKSGTKARLILRKEPHPEWDKN
ncbi:MAG: hypothetical protein EXS14_08435 [Planctomycetes bacterium]|nr:hypothetical protein [Planctomycetota bacterium]